MASVTPKTHPRRRIPRAVMARVGGKQCRITVGKRDLSSSQKIAALVTELENCLKTDVGASPKMIAEVDDLPLDLQERIHRAGLLPDAAFSLNHMTPRELVAWYLEVRGDDLAPNTLRGYKDRLERLCLFCDSKGIDESNRITSKHIEEFKAAEIARTSRITAKTTMRRVKLLFKSAKQHGKLQTNPAADVSTATGKHRVDLIPIDSEWFPHLVACCHDWDLQAALMLARYAGCRCPSEVAGMKWGDWVYPSHINELHVKNVKTIRTNEPIRRVPVFPPLHHFLTEMHKHRFGESNLDDMTATADEYIISSKPMRDNGASYAIKLERNGTWDRWHLYWERLRIDGTPFHYGTHAYQPVLNPQVPYMLGEPIPQVFRACRRSFANDLLTTGCPIQTAAYILGHRVATMVRDYARVSEVHRDWFESRRDINPFE